MMTKRKYPFQTSVARNEEENSYDLMIQIGNFETEADAIDYAGYLVEFLEDNAGAEIGRIQ